MLSPDHDEGFTLIELIVTVVILGIVMVGLTAIVFGTLTTNVATKARLDETRDQQYASTYFGVDAQGATTVVAGAAATCGSGTATIEFRGVSYVETNPAISTVTVVSYVFSTAMEDGKLAGQLRRQSCEAPTGSALVVKNSTVVARNLVTAPPGVSCVPACAGTAPNPQVTSVTLSASRRSNETPFVLVGTPRRTI